MADPWCSKDRSAAWDGLDFSLCLRQRILNGVAPLAFLAASAFAVACVVLYHLRAAHAERKVVIKSVTETPLATISDAEEQEIVPAALAVDYASPYTASDAPEAAVTTQARAIKAKYDRFVVIGVLGVLGLSVVRLVVNLEAGSEGAAWLAFSVAAWACTFTLSLIQLSTWLSTKLAVPFFIVPWLLFSVVASLLDLRSAIITSKITSSTLEWAAFLLVLLTTSAVLITPRPSPRLPATPGIPLPLELNSSLFSLTIFSYLDPLLYRMAFPARDAPPYSLATVPDILPSEKASINMRAYRQGLATLNTKRIQRGRRPRGLILNLLWFNRSLFIQGQLWSYVKVAVVALPPLGLKLLLDHLGKRARGEDAPTQVALLLAVAIAAAQLIQAVTSAQSLTVGLKIELRTRALLISEIFAKALRRSGSGGTSTAGGADITNIIGSDVDDVAPAFNRLNTFWPELTLTILACMYLLFQIIGISSLAGIATLLLVIPIQTLAAKSFKTYQKRLRKAADARLAHVSEIISAIRLVKFEAWEAGLGAKMGELRDVELKQLWAKSLTIVFDLVMMSGVPVVVSVVTFVCHTKVLHRDLDAASAFASLALFQTLAGPLDNFVSLCLEIIGALVSVRRIEDFLSEPETPKYRLLNTPRTSEDPVVGFKNANFAWVSAEKAEEESEAFRLRDISLSFPLGKLSLIVGRVGSGKSTLLSALLGETTCLSGSTFLPSPITKPYNCPPGVLTEAVAYCSQTPWLLSDTIQANILFGSAMDEERYGRVLYACALRQDLKIFELGDLTEVGERGIVLSGGQKARISLARAVYSSAKYLLLDDCLSAVDMHTAATLIETCFQGPLLADRTVVLVTHALDLALPAASYVVRIENGAIVSAGPPDAVVNGAELIKELSVVATSGEKEDPEAVKISEEEAEGKKVRLEKLKLVKDETQSKGAVKASLYVFYVEALGGWWITALALSFFLAAQLSEIGTSLALRYWAGSYDHLDEATSHFVLQAAPTSAPPAFVSSETDFWLRVYCGLALLDMLLYGARAAFWLHRSVIASKSIYARLTKSLLGATVRFYDSTPTGRILNRLSSDTSRLDTRLATLQMAFMLELFGVVGVLVTITAVFPLFLLPASFVALVYVFIGYFYLCASQEFQRSQSVTKSPVFSLFGECLHGVVTLRAYSDTMRFLRKVFELLDISTRPLHSNYLANRWLAIRCDIAGSAICFSAALFVIFSKQMDAALAGFVLTFALSFSEKILWTVRYWVRNATAMNALERVKEYIDIPQETEGGLEPPAIWPSRGGSIEVEDLAVRYTDDLPLALRGVSFKVLPKEKIGIVGRTGSGKSTLGLSFFRFVEASAGRIVIDGIDIRTLSLASLRSRLIIVPHESILLSGTLRSNLDPFDSYLDAELWEVLRRVHLSAALVDLESSDATVAVEEARFVVTSLEMEVAQGGKNFSAGERQLVAIARGVLKLQSSSILILDESTASLDHATDRKIQQTLREVVPDATVLCIAHRIRTIIDYTKILVVGDGQVLEFDAPWRLLEHEDSYFSDLCRSSGEYEVLKKMAFAARDAAA